jgi:hypothetical protein
LRIGGARPARGSSSGPICPGAGYTGRLPEAGSDVNSASLFPTTNQKTSPLPAHISGRTITRRQVSVFFGNLSLNLTHLRHGFFNHRIKYLPALLFRCERVRERLDVGPSYVKR